MMAVKRHQVILCKKGYKVKYNSNLIIVGGGGQGKGFYGRFVVKSWIGVP